MTCFCYVQNKTKLNPCGEKSIFVSYDKQSPAYLIYFTETMAIKRVKWVKFTDSYDNNSLLKPDKNTNFPEYLIIYDIRQKNNQNTKGKGQISHYPIHMIFMKLKTLNLVRLITLVLCVWLLLKYSVAINSVDSNNWILAINREFDSLIEYNTFEWQKAPRNKNIVGSRWIFTMKSKSNRSHEYKVCFIAKGYSQIYGKDYKENFALKTNMASIRLLLQTAVY